MSILSAIVAVSNNLAIGRQQQLPWRLPNDLKFFKQTTLGQIVLMGRKSYDSIGKPLPGRENWILTRQPDRCPEGVRCFGSWEAVQQAWAAQPDKQLFVIGGGEIYAQLLPYCQYLYLTQVQTTIADADTFFPDWNAHNDWVLEWEEAHAPDEKHAFAYCFQRWKRREV